MRLTNLAMGILGTARVNRSIIPAVRSTENIDIVAVASRTRSTAEEFALAWNIPRHYGSYGELLGDDSIDIVYIPLPNSMHAEWTLNAARSGKHVLCEKPLGLNVNEIDQMIFAAKKNKVIIAEALMYRHNEQALEVKRLVDNLEVGPIHTIRGSFCYPGKRLPNDIRFNHDLGGGSLWDLGYYPVSFSNFLVGMPPDEVTGSEHTRAGVDHTFVGSLKYLRGVEANIVSSFDLPKDNSIRIIGEKGEIIIPNCFLRAENYSITIKHKERQKNISINPAAHRYVKQIQNLRDSILFGQEIEITLVESRNNVATITALRQSTQGNVTAVELID